MRKPAIYQQSMPSSTMLHEPIRRRVFGTGRRRQMPQYFVWMSMGGMWVTAVLQSTRCISNLPKKLSCNSLVTTAARTSMWEADAHVERIHWHALICVGVWRVATLKTLTVLMITVMMKMRCTSWTMALYWTSELSLTLFDNWTIWLSSDCL